MPSPGLTLHRADLPPQFGEAELTIQGIDIRPVPTDEALINNGNEIASIIFRCSPDAAVEHGDAKRGEVVGTDGVDADRLVFAPWDTADLDSAVRTGVWGCGADSEGDVADAGHSGNLLPYLFDVCSASFARADTVPLLQVAEVHHDADLHDVIGVVAERKLHEMEKAADGGAGSGHQQQGERDLGSDERAPTMFCLFR